MKKIVIMAISVLMLVSSCDSYTASGAMVGTMVGSTVGRIAGGWRGSDIGALVGAAVGATAGAAARESEIRRAERYYQQRDDVYYDTSRPNDAKAARVARYHANTKAKYSGGRAYSSPSSSRSAAGTGFRLETEGQSYNQSSQSQKDESGRTDKATYDDRIEIK